jgi:hypothetical protein
MIPLALGNCSLIGLEGNNEPFVIGFSDTATYMFCMDNAPSHTVAIYKEVTFVEPLDPKFLPMDAIDERIEKYISEALEGDY